MRQRDLKEIKSHFKQHHSLVTRKQWTTKKALKVRLACPHGNWRGKADSQTPEAATSPAPSTTTKKRLTRTQCDKENLCTYEVRIVSRRLHQDRDWSPANASPFVVESFCNSHTGHPPRAASIRTATEEHKNRLTELLVTYGMTPSDAARIMADEHNVEFEAKTLSNFKQTMKAKSMEGLLKQYDVGSGEPATELMLMAAELKCLFIAQISRNRQNGDGAALQTYNVLFVPGHNPVILSDEDAFDHDLVTAIEELRNRSRRTFPNQAGVPSSNSSSDLQGGKRLLSIHRFNYGD